MRAEDGRRVTADINAQTLTEGDQLNCHPFLGEEGESSVHAARQASEQQAVAGGRTEAVTR